MSHPESQYVLDAVEEIGIVEFPSSDAYFFAELGISDPLLLIGAVNQMIQLKHFTNELPWVEIGSAKSDRLRQLS
jgi:hypothetical protein